MTYKNVVMGQEYKPSEIFPTDVLLFMAYDSHWKITDKYTKVRFVPADHYGVNYTMPFLPSSSWLTKAGYEIGISTRSPDVKNCQIRKVYDGEKNYWKVGYAPEIDVLYVGTGRDGQVCFSTY